MCSTFCCPVLFFVAGAFAFFLPVFLRCLVSCRLHCFVQGSAGRFARRKHADKFSNGDENPVVLQLSNKYSIQITAHVIDEIPVQFQRRDILFRAVLPPGGQVAISYMLKPVKRGTYTFGTINFFVSSSIGLVERRYKIHQPHEVAVYPGYIQMRRYQLMAISNRLTDAGIKKVRKLGHSMEFEQVKEYVQGDDYRTLNWKATARKGQLMINNYTEEKSQQVYCMIDKGRVMKMPFDRCHSSIMRSMHRWYFAT